MYSLIKYQTRTTDLYDGREILSERLSIGCKNAKILISRNSQGASFAAIHKIPTVFIYTNELKEKKNNFLRYQKIFANAFGLDPINIDEEITDKMFKKIITFKNEHYKEYINNYLTARKDDKLNYKIISDIFNF